MGGSVADPVPPTQGGAAQHQEGKLTKGEKEKKKPKHLNAINSFKVAYGVLYRDDPNYRGKYDVAAYLVNGPMTHHLFLPKYEREKRNAKLKEQAESLSVEERVGLVAAWHKAREYYYSERDRIDMMNAMEEMHL